MKNNENDGENSFSDARGSIHFFLIQGIEFHITVTKAGMLRGGDYHPDVQRDIIIKGEMEVTTRVNDRDIIEQYGPNDYIEISPNTPHLFRSLTDTVMIEWREGKFKAEYFAPYREQITKQMKEIT